MNEPALHFRAQSRRRLITIAACAALFAICALLQWGSGAWSADLAGHSDEPAHVVSGLMVYDYVAHLLHPQSSNLPGNPRSFAEIYYVHYPKAAIGRWPPLFYALQAVAMLVLGRNKFAFIVLMLITMAAVAVLLFRVMEPIAGNLAAFVMAAAFLLFRITQLSLYAVMPEALLCLLFVAAALAGGRGLEGSRSGWIVYSLLVVVTILVHGRGAILLVAPWVAILLAGKQKLLRSRALWIVSAAGASVILVWVHYIAQTYPLTVARLASSAAAYPVHAFGCLGPVFFCLTILGVVTVPYRTDPRWALFGATLPAHWIFFSIAIVPWDDRYFMTMLPACVVMSCFGLRFLAAKFPSVPVPILVAGAAAVSLLQGLPLEKKPDLHYESLIKNILNGPDGGKQVYLIAGDQFREGAFIVSLALAERQPRHFAIRSTKAIAQGDWSKPLHPRLRFAGVAELDAYLKQSPISLIALQQDSVRPDVELLRTTVEKSDWQPVPGPPGTLLFRRTAPLPPGPLRVRVEMRGKLGKDLETIE